MKTSAFKADKGDKNSVQNADLSAMSLAHKLKKNMDALSLIPDQGKDFCPDSSAICMLDYHYLRL